MVTVDMKPSITHHAYRHLFLALLFLGLALVVVVAVGLEEAQGRTLYVDDDAGEGGNGSLERPFSRIQDAVNASEDEDKVRVWEGVYFENVVVNKTLNLIGNGSETSTIDGGGSGDVVKITTDWVNMSGFRVVGSGKSSEPYSKSGIKVESNHCRFLNNNCSDNYHGIYLNDSKDCKIENNTCNTNIDGICFSNSSNCTITNNTCKSKYYGISLMYSRDCTITNNTCKNNYWGIILGTSSYCTIANNTCSTNNWCGYGITLSSSSNCTISNNTCSNNSDEGITLSSSSYCVISNNTCSNNEFGMFLASSSDCTISNNTCSMNDMYGMYLYSSDKSTLENNTCSNNADGIKLDSSSYCTLENNTISKNIVGIYLERSSQDNTAHYNKIYNNRGYGIDARINDYTIDATNNWWGNETGPYHPDLNPDGTGDNVTGEVDVSKWLNDDGSVHDPEPFLEEDNSFDDAKLGLLLVGLGGSALAITIAIILSEPFRYTLLRLLSPLYTRLNQDQIESDIAQQNIWGRIYQYIKDQPGINLSSIKAELRIGYGTVVYHLSVLERERYLRSAAEGRKKLFWVKRDFPGIEALGLTDTQRQILEALEKFGPLSRNQLRERTGLVRTTLNSNVKRLLEMGKLEEKEGQGNEKLCSVKLY